MQIHTRIVLYTQVVDTRCNRPILANVVGRTSIVASIVNIVPPTGDDGLQFYCSVVEPS